MEEKIYRYSKKSFLEMLYIFTIPFAILGLGSFSLGYYYKILAFRGVGLFFIATSSIFLIFILKKITDTSPQLILNEEGIFYKKENLKILWKDIQKVQCLYQRGKHLTPPLFIFKVRNHRDYTKGRSLWWRLKKWTLGGILGIDFQYLEGDDKEFVRILKEKAIHAEEILCPDR